MIEISPALRAFEEVDEKVIEALREALECAKIKLSRYREQHPNSHIGGVAAEYDAVVARIDSSLALTSHQSNCAPTQGK